MDLSKLSPSKKRVLLVADLILVWTVPAVGGSIILSTSVSLIVKLVPVTLIFFVAVMATKLIRISLQELH